MPQNLDTLETTITSSVTSLTNILNVPFAPTQIAGFVAEGIFKAIRLGRVIKAAQDRRSEDLETRIRARGVLRTPISADLNDLDSLSFYRSKVRCLSFPLLRQFDAEIQEYRKKRLHISDDKKLKLKLARQLAPILKDDPKLEKPDHADLREIFSISFNPEDINLRALVTEYAALFPEQEQSYREHYERMQGFWQHQVAFAASVEVDRIASIQTDQQQQLDTDVRHAVRDALEGDDGFVAQALSLATRLKCDALKDKIARLKASRDQAEDPAKVDAEISALTSHLTRLGG